MPTPLNNALLEDILDKARPLLGQGKVASYIPALANVDANRLGIAVCTVDGELFTAGDASENFSIQSISKVLSLTLAMEEYESEQIWSRVGKEPSGLPFNSLVHLEIEKGKPRNPFINSGALVLCDLVQSAFSAPKQTMLDTVRRLAQRDDIQYNYTVAESEFDNSARNAAIAYLMKSFGNFNNDVITVLRSYFHYCALNMSCIDLAKCFFYLCNKGVDLNGNTVLSPQQTRHINSMMLTSGMYDGAGTFAYRVGLPGKSGVGGGIIAIVPGDMTIAVWSPELDEHGNSLIGTEVLEVLSKCIGRSIF